MNTQCYDDLTLSRVVVAQAVGESLFSRIPNLRFVTFPNQLSPAKNLVNSGYVLSKVFLICGLKAAHFNPWMKFNLCLNWQDSTFDLIDSEMYLLKSYDYTKIQNSDYSMRCLNFKCTDISKERVSSLNGAVFGYELLVDPCVYEGLVVEKSNLNAAHDGRIIHCPIDPSSLYHNSVYNVLINNLDGNFCVDYRVIYIKGVLELFYEKRRPLDIRFSNKNSSVVVRELRSEFSDDEIESMNSFCVHLGADYGELDVLRDRDSGEIYIVDFAKTPAGPPNGLASDSALLMLQHMSIEFINRVLKPCFV